jgi:hypothetical protein
MMFLDALKAHRGGLVRLKTEDYSYRSKLWDEIAGRIFLLLDSGDRAAATLDPPPMAVAGDINKLTPMLLLIDEVPKWVWSTEDAVELIE